MLPALQKRSLSSRTRTTYSNDLVGPTDKVNQNKWYLLSVVPAKNVTNW